MTSTSATFFDVNTALASILTGHHAKRTCKDTAHWATVVQTNTMCHHPTISA